VTKVLTWHNFEDTPDLL